MLKRDPIAQAPWGCPAPVEPAARRLVQRLLLVHGKRGDRRAQGGELRRDRRAPRLDLAVQLPVLVVVREAKPAHREWALRVVPGGPDVPIGAELAAPATEFPAPEIDGEVAARPTEGVLLGGKGAFPLARGKFVVMACAIGGLRGGRAEAAAAIVEAARAGAAAGTAGSCHGSTLFRRGRKSWLPPTENSYSPKYRATPSAKEVAMLDPQTTPLAHLQPDDALVALWLHGRPPSTVRAYAGSAAALRAFLAPLPLAATTLATLQAFSDTLTGSPAYRRRQLAAIKSLLHFGQRVGALRIDVGAALQLPRVLDRAAERVLTEEEVEKILAAVDGRDRALLVVLYASGARVAELVGLTVGACMPDPRGGGAITLHGKRGSRTVRLGPKAWAALDRLRVQKPPQAAVLGIGIERVRQILARAATRAGLKKKPSPHWLRHSHGTHAHRAGASAALIRDTLGHASIATTDTYLRASPDDGSALWLE